MTPNPVCVNSAVSFTDSSHSYFSAPSTWLWSFGSGATSTLANPIYTFTVAGIYTVTLTVADGHQGEPSLRVIADSDTWLRFLRKEESLPWALIRRRIRLKGSPRLLLAFGRCFPA